VKENEFEGKIAIVTGGAGGIGRALVKAFVAKGIRIGLVDVQADAVRQLEQDYGQDRVLGIVADIADPAACGSLVRQVIEHFGGLHILVNNAALSQGVVREDYFTRIAQIEDISVELWQKFMQVNVSGAFFLAKAAVPIFRAQRWGRIVNVTTSFMTMLRPGFSPYGPTKAALEAWSASLADELKGTGITVNVVVPGGPADTPMVPAISGFDRKKLIDPALMAHPMLWLFTEGGGAVTGSRYLAAEWNVNLPPAEAAQAVGQAAWPGLCGNIVWPD